MRERDARVEIAANAARIRLCMIAVVASPTQSAGISETIRASGTEEIKVTPDTQFVAEDAGTVEPVSTLKFPTNRENNREFRKTTLAASIWRPTTPMNLGLFG